jgi:hypothetical protein
MNESEFAILMKVLQILENQDTGRNGLLELIHRFEDQLNEHQKALLLDEFLHMENKKHYSFEKEDLRQQLDTFIRGYSGD